MNAADRRRLTPTLGIVAAVLVLMLVALWLGAGRAAHWHDDAAPPRLPPIEAAVPSPTVPPLEQFAEVWQRPLFSTTRTPEATGGGDGAASGDLELTGVIMLPGLRMAILHDKTSNRDYRVIEGQPSGDGPALVELHPRSAVVETSGSREQLQLIPGPSPGSSTGQPGNGMQPVESAGQGASGMVTRQIGGSGQRTFGAGGLAPGQAERVRELRARIKAARRGPVRQNDGGG